MKLLNFTIIKLTLCLITGILIGYLFPISLKTAFSISGLLTLLLVAVFFVLKQSISSSYWFGTFAFLCMISFGLLNTSLHDDKQFSNHYTNVLTFQDSTNATITFRVHEILKPSNYHNKYVIDVLKIDSKNLIGKTLLNVDKDSTQQLLKVDAIFIDGLRKWNLYDKVWQAGAILLPVNSVGVMGDERTYEKVVALRAVESTDGMTADWVNLPYEFLQETSNNIINRVKGVNRVVYDISSKPPATIEWE